HITTVSPRYALEIQRPEMGEGLDGVLRARAAHLTGILNGVDVHEWDPATDPHLPAHYDGASLAGKAPCKAPLLTELRLTSRPEAPLLVAVSRFAEQKGIDLIIAAVPRLLASTPCSVAILGSGEGHYESALAHLARTHRDRVAVRIGFDEGLAHRLEAGGDIFLMPSRFEP